MFEKYMILTQEFKNVKDGPNVTGFQVKVRLPYYRGVWLSTVDPLAREGITWSKCGGSM